MNKLILSLLVAVELIGSASAQVQVTYSVMTLSATFNSPTGVAVDTSGKVYVADAANDAIRRIDLYGNVTTFAGGNRGFSDGQGTNARFFHPTGVALDISGNLYVADAANGAIRKIDSYGNVTTVAGNGTGGFSNGRGTNATFAGPAGVAVDTSGNVFVTDYFNNAIRKIDTNGNVTTVAGNGNFGLTNGNGTNATFYRPVGVAVDLSGSLYVSDGDQGGYGAIRKIDTNGNVTTLAGSTNEFFRDGQGAGAGFHNPGGVAVDTCGNVYVGDSQNNAIRKIDPYGNVTTIAGKGPGNGTGFSDGQGTNVTFNWPVGVALDSHGNIYVADSQNNAIRKLSPLCESDPCAEDMAWISGFLPTNQAFCTSLASSTDFLSDLVYSLTSNPSTYGILKQGPQGIQGTIGLTGPAGPQGPQGPIGVFDPTVLTNTSFRLFAVFSGWVEV